LLIIKTIIMKSSIIVKASAFLFTVAILSLGYIAFGFWTALIFTFGFLGGFLIWAFTSRQVPFQNFKAAYWMVLVLFLLHRVEEKVMGFFARLAEITGVSTPDITSVPVILLVLASVGAWLAIPVLVSRNYTFGYYLAWTFFASMGITELAHFVFPLFTNKQPYGYFPGMATVIVLAPFAWWGMYRMLKKGY
jgi:hypothetical protein